MFPVNILYMWYLETQSVASKPQVNRSLKRPNSFILACDSFAFNARQWAGLLINSVSQSEDFEHSLNKDCCIIRLIYSV